MTTTEISAPDLTRLLGTLDQAELGRTIARAAGVERVVTWSAASGPPIVGCVGYAACKALVVVDYVDGAGCAGRVDLALKHFVGWKGGGEEAQYRWLESVGAPVPRLAGALRDEHGDQVLLIERLPYVGFDGDDDGDADALLAALARLNAAPLPPDGVLSERPHTPATLASGAVGEFPRLIEDARAGLLGDEIRDLIVEGASLWPALEAHLVPAVAELSDLPIGLIHGDAGPQNVGWRVGRRELLLFDLHKLHRGCILSDMILSAGSDGGDRADRLARHWLAELVRAGGPALDEDTVRRGRLAYARLQNVGSLWWRRERSIDGMVDWTPDRDEGRRTYRGWLATALRRLHDELARRSRMQAAGGGS